MQGRACCSVAPAPRQSGAPVPSKPSSSLLGVKVAMWYARSRSTRGGTVTSSPRCGVPGLGDADDMAISTSARCTAGLYGTGTWQRAAKGNAADADGGWGTRSEMSNESVDCFTCAASASELLQLRWGASPPASRRPRLAKRSALCRPP